MDLECFMSFFPPPSPLLAGGEEEQEQPDAVQRPETRQNGGREQSGLLNVKKKKKKKNSQHSMTFLSLSQATNRTLVGEGVGGGLREREGAKLAIIGVVQEWGKKNFPLLSNLR